MRNWKAVLGRVNTMEFGIPCLVGVENQQMDEEFFFAFHVSGAVCAENCEKYSHLILLKLSSSCVKMAHQ